MEMTTTKEVQTGARTDLWGQVIAVGAGAAVAFLGGFIGFMGALSCLAGCDGLTPGILVAYVGLAIMACSPFVIARVSNRDRWLAWGALGLATGAAALFLARGFVTLIGSDERSANVIFPCFGLAAAIALPARERWLVAARAVSVLALSMIPILVYDSGVLVDWVVREVPGGRTMGFENHGEFLGRLALLGVPAGLFLPNAIRRRSRRRE